MLIGTRTLRLRSATGDTDIVVSLFAPERTEPSGWACRYTIGWPHEPRDSFGAGHDALQAVSLTLQKIGLEIYYECLPRIRTALLGAGRWWLRLPSSERRS